MINEEQSQSYIYLIPFSIYTIEHNRLWPAGLPRTMEIDNLPSLPSEKSVRLETGGDLKAIFCIKISEFIISKKINEMDGLKHIGILIIGWFFIGVGILGLFLPLLPGILFIMIGLAILSSRSALVKRFLNHIKERYPHHHERIEILRRKTRHLFKKD